MPTEHTWGEGWRLVLGDCVEAMSGMAEDSIDAVVTDPPYGLEFMGQEWDRISDIRQPGDPRLHKSGAGPFDRAKVRHGNTESYGGTFGGEQQEWHRRWASAAIRVLKPGGHIVVFGGSRTYHRMACAVEDAGFEVRDQIQWLYGQGFPKSRDVSKDFDRGVERPVVGRYRPPDMRSDWNLTRATDERTVEVFSSPRGNLDVTGPVTGDAVRWRGWGTALKPASEPILLARKPLSERNLAENVRRWGTGCLNIDACRISSAGREAPESGQGGGRWPANIVLTHHPICSKVGERMVDARVINRFTDGAKPFGGAAGHRYETTETSPDGMEAVEVWACVPECPIRILDSQSGRLRSGYAKVLRRHSGRGWSGHWSGGDEEDATYGDEGGASRFFYVAKATTSERNAGLEGAVEPKAMDEQHRKPRTEPGLNDPRRYGAHRRLNFHPTVKPVDLMRHLCRLVTPPGGTVLDPFVGSGSTGIASLLEGFRFVGVDVSGEYLGIASVRISHWSEAGREDEREQPGGLPREKGEQVLLFGGRE